MDAPHRSPDDLRDLLAAYRDGERMPAATRAAAWRDLQTDLQAPPPVARRSNLVPLLCGAALLAAALLLFILRPAALAPTAPAVDPPQAVHDAAVTPEPRHTVVESTHHDAEPTAVAPPIAPPAVEPPIAPAAGDPPIPSAAAPRPPHRATPRQVDPLTAPTEPSIDPVPVESTTPAGPTPPVVPALERELALLRAARDALARHDAAAAAAALAEHAAEFPRGHLREERLLLRVEALCAAGSRVDARREAAEFAAAHPASPHAKKILRVCP